MIKHIIKSQQFSREWLEGELFPLAKEMEAIVAEGGSDILSGKRMITFFYEPSTRTRASFEIAMDMLGGRVVFSTESATQFSSAAKGETLSDTIRVMNQYHPDVIVLRYHEEGGAEIAAGVSSASIINAGDGTGQHPTQALLDLYTIQKKLGKIDGISIAMVGDLARGRTVRSLSYLLARFRDIHFYFVSPESLRMREDLKEFLRVINIRGNNIVFTEVDDLRPVASKADVIYQTRAQTERGTVFERSDSFIVNGRILESMKKEAIIMHPLPRREEITPEVDQDPRAIYLTAQVESGLFIRMALLKILLSESK